jgi:predicted transcriptional regulator
MFGSVANKKVEADKRSCCSNDYEITATNGNFSSSGGGGEKKDYYKTYYNFKLNGSFERVFIPALKLFLDMTSKNFLLVSLEDNQAKELAQIVSNDICRRILDCLATKEATETEISKSLNIPLSTVHYNLKQLVKSGIVKAGEFHYSEKGREVLHYSLANKYIIIAPKSTATEGLANKLRRILPAVAIVALTGGIIQLFNVFKAPVLAGTALSVPAPMVERTVTDTAFQKTAEAITTGAGPVAQTATTAAPPVALWFLAGALFALVIYLAYDLIRERRAH